jgi:amidohydrolase
MRKKIEQLVDAVIPEITALRREIHRHPELAGDEVNTARLVREVLAPTAIEFLPPYLQTDVVGLLHGSTPGPNVTLRADMDALPLDELTGIDYASRHPGKMHACGHDGHTAVLTGAALVLDKLRGHFNGSVRFVFQPGEEVAAMGHELVKAGALDNPLPKAVFALHAWAGAECGKILSRPGPAMAATGFFKFTITGRGAHGSAPQNSIDPILVGSHLVAGLQAIVARNIDPLQPAVVSVCRFSSGQNSNVIPETAVLEGTYRFLDADIGATTRRLLKEYAEGTCRTFGATCEVELNQPYDILLNTPEYVDMVRETALECLGEYAYEELPVPSMGGEDFCFFLQKAPGAFFRLGNGTDSVSIHSPRFNFNDDAIRNGILMMVNLALKTLK